MYMKRYKRHLHERLRGRGYLRSIKEALWRRRKQRMLREDENEDDVTDDVTIVLTQEEVDLLKSILDKAGCCDDEDEDEDEIEQVEVPEMEDVDAIETTPEDKDSAYFQA